MSGAEVVKLEVGAVLSPDRVYRYSLWRTWDRVPPPLVVIGLNPSTADETEDDPTIRKCMGFARRWGHGGLVMLNLFAFRATDPKELAPARGRGVDIIGPDNDGYLSAATEGRRILCAWGAAAIARDRAREVFRRVVTGQGYGREFVCLRVAKGGAPWHPLYIPNASEPMPYAVR